MNLRLAQNPRSLVGYHFCVERRRNPFTASASGGRLLSALQLPLFLLRPPQGYAVLTTIGRRTGKARRRCVRAVRQDNAVYVVAIKGVRNTGWAKNALAAPVRFRLPGGTFAGRAHNLRDETERRQAREVYGDVLYWFDRLTWMNWRRGLPTSARIRELMHSWIDEGTPLIIELDR